MRSTGINRALRSGFRLEKLLDQYDTKKSMLVDYLILSDRTPAQMFAPEVVVRYGCVTRSD
jgi:hypothetical protein